MKLLEIFCATQNYELETDQQNDNLWSETLLWNEWQKVTTVKSGWTRNQWMKYKWKTFIIKGKQDAMQYAQYKGFNQQTVS